jgi:hypothetical protein
MHRAIAAVCQVADIAVDASATIILPVYARRKTRDCQDRVICMAPSIRRTFSKVCKIADKAVGIEFRLSELFISIVTNAEKSCSVRQ